MADNLLHHLCKKGLISELQSEEALHLAEKWKTPLPRTLLAMGLVNGLELYRAIADYLKLPFVNLQHTPSQQSLLDYQQRDEYQRLEVIPCKTEKNMTWLACAEPTDALHQWATEHYGKQYRFAITSPYDIQEMLFKAFGQQDDLAAREQLWKYQPESSAKSLTYDLDVRDWWLPLMLLAFGFSFSPLYSLLTLFAVANLFYITTLAVKWGLFLSGNRAYQAHKLQQGITSSNDSELPIYTLLIPLYKETAVLPKLIHALQGLDYPKAKLDIKLIVEEDDHLTINTIKALKCGRIFEIIRVPYSLPRTKPKACNYALRFAKGDYVTIYDAEDIPDPLQLKKALWTFEQSSKDTVCVQARLNYFNRNENWLTKLFALEYSGLFDFLLWGIEKLHIPIPLGGTSNHFKMEALRTLYAWDPYNVTEDADLGIRVAKQGWKVTVMDSLTLEEAPISVEAWIKQRSRWIKGHMQTYLVHMRRPLKLWKQLGTVGFFGFQFFLGAPCLIFIFSPFLWFLWLVSIFGLLPAVPEFLPPWLAWVLPVSATIFFGGLAIQMLFAAWIIIRRKWWNIWYSALLFPFYWLLHSVASFRALWQLFKQPYYWEKTTHGVTKIKLEANP